MFAVVDILQINVMLPSALYIISIEIETLLTEVGTAVVATSVGIATVVVGVAVAVVAVVVVVDVVVVAAAARDHRK